MQHGVKLWKCVKLDTTVLTKGVLRVKRSFPSMKDCPPALGKMTKATELLFDGINIVISKRVATLLSSIADFGKQGAKLVSPGGILKLQGTVEKMGHSMEDFAMPLLYLKGNIQAMLKAREHIEALFAMTSTLKRLFEQKVVDCAMVDVPRSATVKRIKVTSSAAVEFHRYNASEDGTLSADEVRPLMMAMGFSSTVLSDDYVTRVVKPFASTSSRAGTLIVGVAIEDFPAFRERLDVELVLQEAGKTKPTDSMVTQAPVPVQLRALPVYSF